MPKFPGNPALILFEKYWVLGYNIRLKNEKVSSSYLRPHYNFKLFSRQLIHFEKIKKILNYLERAMADFFWTLSAAAISAWLRCGVIFVSSIAKRNPTPSKFWMSCRMLALAARLARTVTTCWQWDLTMTLLNHPSWPDFISKPLFVLYFDHN